MIERFPFYLLGLAIKLKKLKNKEIDKYDCLFPKDLQNASDEALKNLATSWGPFQLMGYKCLELGVTVKDLRGRNTIDHSVDWIFLRCRFGEEGIRRQFGN